MLSDEIPVSSAIQPHHLQFKGSARQRQLSVVTPVDRSISSPEQARRNIRMALHVVEKRQRGIDMNGL